MKDRLPIVWITVFPHPLYTGIFVSFPRHLVMLLAERYRRKGEQEGCEVRYVGYAQPLRVTGAGYFRNFAKEMESLKPKAIIVNLHYSLPALQAYLFAKKNNVPLYVSAEEDGYRNAWQRLFFPLWDMLVGRRIISYARAILAWSRDSQQFMERIAKGRTNVVYFPAGIEVPEPMPRRSNSSGEALRIIFPARFVPVKNHALLLDALRILKSTHELAFELTLIGDGPLRNVIETRIEELGLEEQVRCLGVLPREEVLKQYALHDVIVLPGRHETIGFAVLEAMAHGVVPIVSDTLGARDFIQEGVSGFLFQSGSAADLAQVIARTAQCNRVAIGASAYHRACDFSIAKQIKRLEAILSL